MLLYTRSINLQTQQIAFVVVYNCYIKFQKGGHEINKLKFLYAYNKYLKVDYDKVLN